MTVPEIERYLAPAQLDLLRRASDSASQHGVALYLVGGSVRDMLLGVRPADLDLVAEGATTEFASQLAMDVGGEVVARSQFQTSKLVVGDMQIDVAMSRTETYARPGALPAVSPGSIQEDLKRRDFSANAIAVSLDAGDWGRLLDPLGGARDLELRQIRVLHAGSFVDDATRILRAVRYATRLGFRLEPETERLLRRDLRHLGSIGGERVRNELERIFDESRAAEILAFAQELGVLSAIHAGLSIGTQALQALVSNRSDDPLVPLGVLMFETASAEADSLIARLGMDAGWAKVVRDVGAIKEVLPRLRTRHLRPSHIYALLHGRESVAIEACALAAEEEIVRERLTLYLAEIRHVRPLLNGNDLMALGVPEGPRVGELLAEVLNARLDGLLSTRDDEERLVLRRLE